MTNGGKAISLKELQKAGFLVPRFFVCDASWPESRIASTINSFLPNVKYFAVRSSAENEDSKLKSFAGHFYSGICIPKNKVYEEMLKVKNSFGNMKGSVIIQEFIPSDTAGIMFSQIDEDKLIINSTLGLCLPVVGGKSCDEYVCDKNGQVVNRLIVKKVTILFIDNKLQSKTTEEESLNPRRIKELTKLAKKIQKLFATPQDIEWCFLEEKLYVLQSRPITKNFNIRTKELVCFDSANIAESYSGIVLPLTCSFAKMAYERVYKDLLRMSGISNRKIEEHSKIFENLLGFFYGRMYYNMNNWYLMAAFAPGYKRNKQNFERMITSNLKQEITTTIKPSFLFRLIYPEILAFKMATYGFSAGSFKNTVKEELKKLNAYDFSQLQYEKCISLFRSINHSFLNRWYIAVENDFFVMTYLGILSKIIDEQQLQKIIIFQSKATEQINSLANLSKKMSKVRTLWSAILDSNVKEFQHQLSINPEINEFYNQYSLTFGGRFANELKLESVGTDEDITKLFSALKAYKNYKPTEYKNPQNIQLPFIKKLFMKTILHQFKKYASQREEFRLLRSNTFGMTRRLFRRMGTILAEQNIIKKTDDVFYFELEELMDNSILENRNIKMLINQRKNQYLEYKRVTPPSYFTTTDNKPPGIVMNKKNVHKVIQARPASSGIVKGKVRVFKDFFMPEKIDFDILVTSHTDPGWTSLIGLSKGLIVEHGGVLSHASIVARELNIPAVIGATDIVNSLNNGQIVEIDGSKGTISVF